MKRILLLALLLAVDPVFVRAADVSVDLTAEYSGEWAAAGSGSYVLDGWGRRNRVSVRLYAGSEAVAQWWDDPTDREQDFTATFDDTSPRVCRFTARAWCYAGGPWEASRTYAIGENVAVGSPVWEGLLLTAHKTGALATADVVAYFASADEVEDNGDGTVDIPIAYSVDGFVAGDVVTLWGVGPYDGIHTLPTQASTAALTITASYTAHTVAADETFPNARLVAGASGSTEPTWPVGKTITDGGVAVDNLDTYTQGTVTNIATGAAAINYWDGTVGIPCPAHGLTGGDKVVITGTVNYDGTYWVSNSSGVDVVRFVVKYVAETFTGTETVQGLAYAETHTISLPCPAHGFVEGDEVLLEANSVYDGPHTLPAQADPDLLTIAAPYAAFTVDGSARVMRRYTVDNGVTWEVLPNWLTLPFTSSYSSNRVLIRGTGGESGSVAPSGMKFHLRGQ